MNNALYAEPPASFHRPLFAFAASAFLMTLATDAIYWRTADFFWLDSSDWLVTIGVIVGAIALIVGAIEALARRPGARSPVFFWLFAILAWISGLADALVHTRDGWTSVVPLGIALSALTVVLLLLAGQARAPAYIATRSPA